MKKITIAVLAVIAIITLSSLSLAIESASALTTTTDQVANRPTQKSWIRINGNINKWGTTDASGLLQTMARTALLESSDTRQLASASAIWTTNLSRPINAVRAKENFTYTFYAARLTNASVSTLSASTSASNYFLNGTWNIFTVKTNVTIITDNGAITRVHRDSDTSVEKAYGELNVTDNWSKFTLTLTGIDPLTGSVFRSMTRQIQFNPFKVSEDESSNVVTRADVKAVVKCYRAMPGWGSYDSRMDFNNNFKIDIADLSTVAANM